MARMIAEVYDALRSAGADDDKARAAATAVAESDRDVADLRLEMSGVRTEGAEIRGDMRLLTWMVGFTIAPVLGVLGTVLRMLQLVG
jgi:hypothetical protein